MKVFLLLQSITILFTVSIYCCSTTNAFQACGSPKLSSERILSKRYHETMKISDVPTDHFWGDVNGTNYLTESRNQHIPQYCGSCWAFGTLSSLNDRLKIANEGKATETILAPQVLINCGGGGSCDGGNVGGVFDYMTKNGLPDEACQNYEATNDIQCKPTGICETCAPGKNCTEITSPKLWTLQEYGYVNSGSDYDIDGVLLSSVDKIKAEVSQGGPVACGIHATPELEAFGTTTPVDSYPGGIFHQKALLPTPNHILSIVGYGHDVSVNKSYWILRNSWGTYWGENGYGKIQMGNDNLGIDGLFGGCSFATPVEMKPKTEEIITETKVKKGTFHNYEQTLVSKEKGDELITSPLPRIEDAPAAFDIRDVDGVNYATPNRNQHIPNYCGSCWAFATSSALGDRFKMARKAIFPEIFLSPQYLVNCITGSRGCDGGHHSLVYPYYSKNGGVDETCQNYQAKNLKCDAEGTCINCSPSKGCFPMGTPANQNNFTKYYVEQYGNIQKNASQMMAEISARGPIACGMCVTESFENYKTGVFKDNTGCTRQDHVVAISGYGTDAKDGDYWIVRNSWGRYWGEDGWFKIARATNNMGIEESCSWGVPKL